MKGVYGLAILFLMLSQKGSAQTSSSLSLGRSVFENNCTRCHGEDGSKGKWGAKNLQISTLSDEQLQAIISQGKNVMPSWKRKLSSDQIRGVMDYIKTFRSFTSPN